MKKIRVEVGLHREDSELQLQQLTMTTRHVSTLEITDFNAASSGAFLEAVCQQDITVRKPTATQC